MSTILIPFIPNMDDRCHYCHTSIFLPDERAYLTCEICQKMACKKCFASDTLPIIYFRYISNQHIHRYCTKCYANNNRYKN